MRIYTEHQTRSAGRHRASGSIGEAAAIQHTVNDSVKPADNRKGGPMAGKKWHILFWAKK